MSRLFDGDFRRVLNFLWDHREAATEAVSLVNQIASADAPIDTTEGVKERLVPALKLAKLVATFTATTKDDEAIAAIDKVVSNEDIVSGIASLIHMLKGADHNNLIAAMSDSHLAEEAFARGINWAKLVEIFKTILPYLLPLLLAEGDKKDA